MPYKYINEEVWFMLQILGAFLQSSLMAIFYLIIIILGIFAGKRYRDYKDTKKK